MKIQEVYKVTTGSLLSSREFNLPKKFVRQYAIGKWTYPYFNTKNKLRSKIYCFASFVEARTFIFTNIGMEDAEDARLFKAKATGVSNTTIYYLWNFAPISFESLEKFWLEKDPSKLRMIFGSWLQERQCLLCDKLMLTQELNKRTGEPLV